MQIIVSDHTDDGKIGVCQECHMIDVIGTFFGVKLCSQCLMDVSTSLTSDLFDFFDVDNYFNQLTLHGEIRIYDEDIVRKENV